MRGWKSGTLLFAAPLVMGLLSAAAWAGTEDMVAIQGDTPALARHATDNGRLDPAMSLPTVQLLLARPAGRQAALDHLVVAQQRVGDPMYHHWLTPAELRDEYGAAPADIQRVTDWLTARGMTNIRVSPTNSHIDFAATVGQVEAAFHTEMHAVTLRGENHIGAMIAPSIPRDLAGVIRGVVLSNFFPHPLVHSVGTVTRDAGTGKWHLTGAAPGYTLPAPAIGATLYPVSPLDFSTIYNLNPARAGGSPIVLNQALDGTGQTVAAVEQTDILPKDWQTFRAAFGLAGYAGSLTLTHPNNCGDAGFIGDETEAALDVEWISASAPAASVLEASCPETATTFGVLTSLQGLVETPTPAQIFSISYGGCETGNGLTFIDTFTDALEMGASEGKAIFVSTGDEAAAGCDDPNSEALATGGIAVNGLASSAYDTAVGGTDFLDTSHNTNSHYWAATNGPYFQSALSYIPEGPWDDSCAGSVLLNYEGATDATTYCNLPGQPELDIVGGSGGRSVYFAKPAFQLLTVPGMPNDGVRDLPDISLFSSNGFWNHDLLYCMSDARVGGKPCNYNTAFQIEFDSAGGTSFAAPAMAGIAAMETQLQTYIAGGTPALIGNFAPRLYQLAQLQFTNPLLASSCKSSLGSKVSKACIFYDVNSGNMAVPCAAGSPDCKTTAASTAGIGILTDPASPGPAYPALVGYDLATGLGTVNVLNLLSNY